MLALILKVYVVVCIHVEVYLRSVVFFVGEFFNATDNAVKHNTYVAYNWTGKSKIHTHSTRYKYFF